MPKEAIGGLAVAVELKDATSETTKIQREREIAERAYSVVLEELDRVQEAVKAADANEQRATVKQQIEQRKAEDGGIACAAAEASVCRARAVWETSDVTLEKALQRLFHAFGDGSGRAGSNFSKRGIPASLAMGAAANGTLLNG